MSPRRFLRRPPAESGKPVESADEPEPAEAVGLETPVNSIDSFASTAESGALVPTTAAQAALAPTTPVQQSAPTARFRISRWRKGDRKPHFDDFDVAVEAGGTLLDALLEIRSRHDPSLVMRHSCMHASCGTCGVRVNGRERLACDTRVADLPTGKPIKVEPIAGQRRVADLATDMVDFYARFEAAGMPQVRAAGVPLGLGALDSIQSFWRFENCIECGLCLSACPVARTSHDFIGPAALAAAARVVVEPRGAELGPLLALAAEPDSVWRCHSAMECTAVCPSGVDPARALLELRRRVAVSGVKRLLARGG
jgi:succinate dehydrogenase / fumarate reductase iron-sulfur subunit